MEMTAVRIHAYGGADRLVCERVARPLPGANEVLVRVHAVSVNPVDYKVREGALKAMLGESILPTALGADLAGTVEALGAGVTAFAPGDEVFAMIGLFGAYAEYVAVKVEHLAHKPRGLTFVQAASLPLVALTAWQALVDTLAIADGQNLLIHAAAGGVGSVAVQLARSRGARVTGTCSAANADYVLSLGAHRVIDYQRTPIQAMPQDFDAVLDLVGGDTGPRSIDLLKPGGTVVVVAGRPAPRAADAQNRRLLGIVVRPSGAQLALIANEVDQGWLRPQIAAVLPLQRAAEAHALVEQNHTRGKIVLKVGES